MTEIQTEVDLAYLTRFPLTAYQVAHVMARLPPELGGRLFALLGDRLPFWDVASLHVATSSGGRERRCSLDAIPRMANLYRIKDSVGDTVKLWPDDAGGVNVRFLRADGEVLEHNFRSRLWDAVGKQEWGVPPDAKSSIWGSRFMPLGVGSDGAWLQYDRYPYHMLFLQLGWMPDLMSFRSTRMIRHDPMSATFVSLKARGAGLWVFETLDAARNLRMTLYPTETVSPFSHVIPLNDMDALRRMVQSRIGTRDLDTHPFLVPLALS